MKEAMRRIMVVTAEAATDGYSTKVLTHGSGPQTGIIMDRAALSEKAGMHPLYLRYATMDLIGSLGMTFQHLIHKVVAGKRLQDFFGEGTSRVTLNPTAFIVDPATMKPAKPIGGALDEAQVAARKTEGYTVENRDGKGQRVLVPSPKLLETFDDDLFAIASAIKGGALSIAGGTGGLALEDVGGGVLEPRDAVIDKDRAWVRIMMDLATKHGVTFDTGVIFIDAPVVCKDFSRVKPALEEAIAEERALQGEGEYRGMHNIQYDKLLEIFSQGDAISHIAAADMKAMLEGGQGSSFSGGAIAKVEAACDLVLKAGARRAIICCLDNFARALMDGDAGTIIERGTTWA